MRAQHRSRSTSAPQNRQRQGWRDQGNSFDDSAGLWGAPYHGPSRYRQIVTSSVLITVLWKANTISPLAELITSARASCPSSFDHLGVALLGIKDRTSSKCGPNSAHRTISNSSRRQQYLEPLVGVGHQQLSFFEVHVPQSSPTTISVVVERRKSGYRFHERTRLKARPVDDQLDPPSTAKQRPVARPSSRSFARPECHTDHAPRSRSSHGHFVSAHFARVSVLGCRRQLRPRVMDTNSVALLPTLVVGIVVRAGPSFAQG